MCSWPWELSKKKAPRHVKNQPNSWDDLLVPLNLCRICMTTIYEILPDGMACTDFDPFRSGQKTNNTDCGKSPAKKQEKLVCGKCTSCLQNMLGHYSFVFIFFRMVTKGSVSYLSSPCFSTSIGGIGGPARAKRGILAVMYWISIIRGGPPVRSTLGGYIASQEAMDQY
jgi:hypothetical protein